MKIRTKHAKGQTGASLIESMIAVAVFSLGMLAAMTLQTSSSTASDQVKFRADAMTLVSELEALMMIDKNGTLGITQYAGTGSATCFDPNDLTVDTATPSGATKLATWCANVSRRLPNANATASLSAATGTVGSGGVDSTIVVSWSRPGDPDERSHKSFTRIAFN